MKKTILILVSIMLVISLLGCETAPSDVPQTTDGETTAVITTKADDETATVAETTVTAMVETTAVETTTEEETTTAEETTAPHTHTVVKDKGKVATCTATGLSEGSHCSVCGEVIKKQSTLRALGHVYSKNVVSPTLTSPGYDEYVCSRCGDSYKENYTPYLTTIYSEEQLQSIGLGFVLTERTDTELSENIWLSTMKFTDVKGVSHVAYAVLADPNKVSLELGFPGGASTVNGLSSVINQLNSAKNNLGYDIVAGINADLFKDKHPNGTTIVNGNLVYQDNIGYQGFALMNDGTFRFSNYAKEFESYASSIKFACGGRYLVLQNGNVIDNGTADKFCTEHHPRTAFGVRYDGTLIFLVVDGRQAGYSDGATLLDLSAIFARLGAYNAINLDGGGSTGLYFPDGKGSFYAVDRPSEKNRAVVNTLMLVRRK